MKTVYMVHEIHSTTWAVSAFLYGQNIGPHPNSWNTPFIWVPPNQSLAQVVQLGADARKQIE